MMTNLKLNAIRIAELLGYDLVVENSVAVYYHSGDKIQEKTITNLFSSYNGLMPIIFECNQNSCYSVTIQKTRVILTAVLEDRVAVYYDSDKLEKKKSELEFVEALQTTVIKYLELKKEKSNEKETN